MPESIQLISQLYQQTLLELNLSDTDERIIEIGDAADEAAIELISMAGFDAQDSDHFGDEMGDAVQTLLRIVMIRCPQLAARITGLDEMVNIVAQEQ